MRQSLKIASHSKKMNVTPSKFGHTRKNGSHLGWARHSKFLARGPMVLGTARLIYTTKYGRVFSMFISGTATLKQKRHS